VGVILKAIENAHERAGAFISAILGTAWTVMTFFVVPALVVERVGPFDAIKRSIQILKRNWGEAIIGNVGIGLFVFLLALPGIVVGLFGFFALQTAVPLGVAVIVLAALYLLTITAAVGPALHGIYLAALYQYAANGEIPSGFDRGELKQAFRRKN
jgi:hypothetical protein